MINIKSNLVLYSHIWNHLTVCKEVINIKIELLVFGSNTWNHLTVCKQLINIK